MGMLIEQHVGQEEKRQTGNDTDHRCGDGRERRREAQLPVG